jgi:hypothetical protein
LVNDIKPAAELVDQLAREASAMLQQSASARS